MFTPAGGLSTRLLPVSVTYLVPLPSTAAPVGVFLTGGSLACPTR
jgi:hypothetical protein